MVKMNNYFVNTVLYGGVSTLCSTFTYYAQLLKRACSSIMKDGDLHVNSNCRVCMLLFLGILRNYSSVIP